MNLFRSRGVDVFEAINKGDWQKVKDNVVPGKVSETKNKGAPGACGSFPPAAPPPSLPLSPENP